MPHQCTNCGRTFADGSKEMLSGCPDCGGNKFQFRPAGATDSGPPETTESGNRGASTPSRDDADRDTFAGSDPSTSPDPSTGSDPSSSAVDAGSASPSTGTDDSSRTAPDTEDGAQASARSDVVSPDELAAAAEPTEPASEPPESRQADDEPAQGEEPADPNLDALRQKLNDQFESIRIVSPGQYELNLMELYDREEYIISLREDGRYVIEMPEGWDDR
ncbi:Zn-ribbon domain-containing protein [Halobaculum magnesiiphilum]|uniref:Zn-ribbon domain-containing protein n=1 Tax=Halobaculum magnesiiphilum TaxID=1017351 RepID=A0A8T8W9C3_9EURY|nr:Zn-ribbon domain-containing protein [Halobaculum magnesiiphilum]QZP36430.1 Zn-ribbon domain-containing protein [Halobaculum magnesiiphilum]